MKTPREILLEQHRSVTPKLDAIRREVVAAAADVNRRQSPVRDFTFTAALANALRLSFQELIWPCRRTWAGLAVVWILIFAVNLCLRDPSTARATKSSATSMIMALRDQQKILTELLGDRIGPSDTDRPKVFSPKPRTERIEILTT